MSEKIKLIRFIDRDYREQFKIPDSGNVKIIYPPRDDRGTIIRQCRYLDETHIELSGSGSYRNIYNICEFAERMEAIGARYEPEIQLQDAEIVPFAAGDEKFYTYNREKGNTCVGHISGSFGSDGERYRSNWQDRVNDRNTLEFQTELQSVVYALRRDLLKDSETMLSYCQSHPEAILTNGENYEIYGFRLKTDTRQYFIRCIAARHDPHFIVYAYDKVIQETVPEKQPKSK